MTKFRGTVEVMMRPGIVDPHGRSIMNALKGAGFTDVTEVRSGKLIEVEFECDPDKAAITLERMAHDLLANRVTEVYALKIDEIHPAVVEEDLSPIVLLEASIAGLEDCRDPAEINERLDRAEIYLHGAQADLAALCRAENPDTAKMDDLSARIIAACDVYTKIQRQLSVHG